MNITFTTLAELCTRSGCDPRSRPDSSTTANEIRPARWSANRFAAVTRSAQG